MDNSNWLIRVVLAVALAFAPLGGEILGRWALLTTYGSLLYVVDPQSLILASWGVGASISLLVLAASVSSIAALLFGERVVSSLRSSAWLVIVTGAVPALFAVFAGVFGLPVEGVGDAYAAAAVTHLVLLALTIPSAAITAINGRIRGFTDVIVAFVAGVLSLFISALLGFFLVRSVSGNYIISTSIDNVYELNIGVVGAQIIAYELFLLFILGTSYRR